MSLDGTTRRRLAKLEAALSRVEAAALAGAEALPPRPSAQRRAALPAIAAEIRATAGAAAQAARELKAAEAASLKQALDTQALVARHAGRVAEALEWVAAAPPVALVRTAEGGPEARRIALLSRAFSSLESAVNGAAQSPDLEGQAYPFVPTRPEWLLERLEAAWRLLAAQGRAEGARLLEVGSGAGTKLHILRLIFPNAEGIEIDETYIARAGLMAGEDPPRITKADAMTFERYGEFDAIFLYQPFRDEEMETRLERCIEAEARPGTVVIAPVHVLSHFHSLEQAAGGVVAIGHDGEALARLVAEAEQVGPVVPPERPEPRRAKGRDILHPALAAVAAAGFET